MTIPGINLFAVLVSAVASMIIGFVYYGPVFQKQYLDAAGFTIEEAQTTPPSYYGASFVFALVEAFFLAVLLRSMGSTGVASGLVGGFMVWLGFVATITGANALFDKTSLRLWLLQNGNNLLVLLAMGAILAVWQ